MTSRAYDFINTKSDITETPIKIGISHLMVLFFILQLIVAFFTYYHSLTFDEAMWQYIGRNWFRNGLIPYSGGVDNKSPLIFAIFGLSDKFLGVNFWFPRLVGICFQTTGIFFLYKVGNFLFSNSTAIIATIIYGLTLTCHSAGGKFASNTESYSVACIIASAYFVFSAKKKSTFLVAGIIAGIGCAFRLTGFFGATALMLILLINRKQNVFVFLVGVVVAIFFFIILFYFSGINLHNVFVNLFSDNFSKGGVAGTSVSGRIENFYNNFLISPMVILLPAIIIYCFMKEQKSELLIWLLLEFIGISIIGLYANQHFKNLLPPLVLINASVLNYFIEAKRISFKTTIRALCIFLFPILTEPILSLEKQFFSQRPQNNTNNVYKAQQPDDDERKILGLWIKANTSESDKVLIAGYGAQIQAYSERVSPSIYFNITQTEVARNFFLKELNTDKPAMILVPAFQEYADLVNAETRKYISDIIATDYRYEYCLCGYNIYRKKWLSKIVNLPQDSLR